MNNAEIVTIDNILYLVGGNSRSSYDISNNVLGTDGTDGFTVSAEGSRKEIITWDADKEKWNTETVGEMDKARTAMAVVAIPDVENFCADTTPSTVTTVLNEIECVDLDEKKNDNKNLKRPFIDIFLDPDKSKDKDLIIDYQQNISRDYFTHLESVYPELFRLLWHSSLPCSPQPASTNSSLVHSCQVAGETVDCAALFTKVPTDLGMCCALSTDDILRDLEYGKLVKHLEGEEKGDKEKKFNITAGVGMEKGVKLVLDLHSNEQAFGSVYDEHRGFQIFIGQRSEFPVLHQRSLPIQPGAEHSLDLSATSLTSDGIRGIKPQDRHCYFQDEGNLDFYKEYSYKSCVFECKVKYVIQ